MHPKPYPLCLLLLLCCTTMASSLPDVIKLPTAQAPIPPVSLEHLDPTLPPVLADQTPQCTITVLQKDFAGTAGEPPVSVNYTQPQECPFPWTHVVLELSVTASDLQQERVAAVWIEGAEVLRTMTPRPMAPGAYWSVRKDVTRYASLLGRRRYGGRGDGTGTVSMMLENSIDVLPGVFSANVSLHFYRGSVGSLGAPPRLSAYTSHPTIKSLYRKPADLVIPISNPDGQCASGFWFHINNDSHVESTSITIPRNTYRAALEIFASYHGDDELWYMNPLKNYYLHQAKNLSTPRSNGGFRQVYATIDGQFAGGHIPLAVLYSGSVNPYFWSPVASISSFDMPTYDLDLTPFLGLMLDGRPHELGLGVHDAQRYWLLSANLHLWVDDWSDVVQAGVIEYFAPPLQMNRNVEWREVDGQSAIEAEGFVRFSGWVSSSHGNLTTHVRHKTKYQSQVEVQNRGRVTQVEMLNKQRMTVAVVKGHQLLHRVQLLVEAPLQVQTSIAAAANGAKFEKARMFHQLLEMVNLNEGQVVTTATLTDRQDAEGQALVRGDEIVWGSGTTRSAYRYKDGTSCYTRNVNAAGGMVMTDIKAATC